MAVYEVRRGDTVLCTSSVPDLGYRSELLREMELDGYEIYIDGKRRPRREKSRRAASNPPGLSGLTGG